MQKSPANTRFWQNCIKIASHAKMRNFTEINNVHKSTNILYLLIEEENHVVIVPRARKLQWSHLIGRPQKTHFKPKKDSNRNNNKWSTIDNELITEQSQRHVSRQKVTRKPEIGNSGKLMIMGRLSIFTRNHRIRNFRGRVHGMITWSISENHSLNGSRLSIIDQRNGLLKNGHRIQIYLPEMRQITHGVRLKRLGVFSRVRMCGPMLRHVVLQIAKPIPLVELHDVSLGLSAEANICPSGAHFVTPMKLVYS